MSDAAQYERMLKVDPYWSCKALYTWVRPRMCFVCGGEDSSGILTRCSAVNLQHHPEVDGEDFAAV